jgi:hypothetical protein
MKNIIQRAPDLISPESVKNIACVDENINKLDERKSYITYSKFP